MSERRRGSQPAGRAQFTRWATRCALLLLTACATEPTYDIALDLVRLNSPDYGYISVNPNSVVDMRGAKEIRQGHYHSSVKCLIYTVDGKYIPVTESCAAVESLLTRAAKGQ